MPDGPSIIELLRRDHERIKATFARLDVLAADEVADYFCELREELVRHEVAEELVVFPVFSRDVPGGTGIVDRRIAEQAAAEEVLRELEREDPLDAAFRARLEQLRAEILRHAKEEEETILPALAAHASSDALSKLGDRYEKALRAAPTHPHPHAPDRPPGNALLGPVAALVDRFRDAMRAA